MMQKLRWGILGTGRIASKAAAAFSAAEGNEIVAVGSRNRQTAEQFAYTWNIPQAYGSYEALANSPLVDVVYVATPNAFHFDNVALCIQRGKHVLCEKPFTVNAIQADKLFELAKQKKVFLMEALWSRFVPGMQQAIELVQSGALGRIHMVQADYGFRAPVDPQGRHHSLALAGGALLDVGIYPLALAHWFLGNGSAQISSLAQIGPTGVDVQNAFVLQFNSGAMAQLSSSFCGKTANLAVISGEHGRLILDRFWCAEHLVWERDAGTTVSRMVPIESNGYEYELMEVSRCIGLGLLESPMHSWSDTLRLLFLMDSMRKSWNLSYPGE